MSMSTSSLLKVIDWIDEIAIYMRQDYGIIAMNVAAASFFACDPIKSTGKNLLRVCSENREAIPDDAVRKVLNTGEPITLKVDVAPDKNLCWRLLPAEETPAQSIILLGKYSVQQSDTRYQADRALLIEQVKEVTGQDVEENLSLPSYANMIRHYYEKLIDHMPHNVYWLNKNCVTLGCNQNVLRLIGLTKKEQFIGITYEEMGKQANWTERQAESFKRDDMEVMRTNKPKKNVEEPPLYDEKNNPVYYLSSRKPLYSNKGEIIGVVGISVDITDKKKVEKLKCEQDIAQKTIRKLKAISAGLSYEVRGSMAGIRLGLDQSKYFFGQLSQLIKSMKDCTKCQSHSELTSTDIVNQKHLLDKMKHRIDTSIVLMEMQLKNMITDHIEKRFFQCHKIKDSVEDAVSSFPMEEASFQNKIHIALQHDFAVSGDGLLTKHLFWNLLNNALHFIKEEGRGEIFITTEEMIEYYLLRFKDTAKGMPVSETKKVFEPLYTTRNNGSGLGLHFCQLVMKAYGGKIECCAQEGKQTEFLLFFPKKQSKK